MASGDSVDVRYTGWLHDPATGATGAQFDSTWTLDEAFRFTVGKGNVIQGWETGC